MNQGPIILGVDASTGRCSAALSVGAEVLAQAQTTGRGQADILLAQVEVLLSEAQIARSAIDAIAFCQGPGGFTGVRIGVGVAQGLAYGLDCPAIGLSTLAVLAQAAQPGDTAIDGVLALLDARMGEVYGGLFRSDAATEWLASASSLALPAGRWWGVGSGFAEYPALQESRGLAGCEPDKGVLMHNAMKLAQAAYAAQQWVAADAIAPVYLRNRVADRPGTSTRQPK